LIDLQEGSSIDMGRVLHSTTVAVDTIGHVSSQMKRKLLTKIIERRSKINDLAGRIYPRWWQINFKHFCKS